jgi:hypothetical protein
MNVRVFSEGSGDIVYPAVAILTSGSYSQKKVGNLSSNSAIPISEL